MKLAWLSKNIGAINQNEQMLLFNSRILICGCGGIGGICVELLTRVGIGTLMIIDDDKFDITNLNRQIYSNLSVVGKYKIDVIRKQLKLINPKIKIYGFKKRMEPKTFEFYTKKLSLLKPQIIIDSFDSASSRMILDRIAKKLKIPHLYAGCAKARGFVTILTKNQSMEKCFNLPSARKELKKGYKILQSYPSCPAAWGPITNFIGAAAVNATLNYLLKKGGFPIFPYYWAILGWEKEILRFVKF